MLNMYINGRVKQTGIALIQVLIISIILSMLAIFISQTVRSQVATAAMIKEHKTLVAQVESAQSTILHTLLSNKRYQQKQSDDSIVQQWNFFGEPFEYQNGTVITIQDQYGLLSLNHFSPMLARRLFELLEQKDSDYRYFIDSLADWKDKDDLSRLNGAESNYYESLKKLVPRNSYLQSMAEVGNIRGADMLTSEQWQKYFSLALISKYNPLNSPDKILQAFVNNDEQFAELVSLRENGELNQLTFYQLTGIEEDDFITFSTGRLLKIKITVNMGDAKLSKQFNLTVRPNHVSRPIVISDVEWNK